VGPTAGLDAVVKRPVSELGPPIIQPVAKRYTTELTRLLNETNIVLIF